MGQENIRQWIIYPGLYKLLKLPRERESQQPHVELEQFVSITYSPDDVALICPQESETPDGGELRSDNWRVLQIKGAYDMDNVKLVASLSSVLRRAGIKLFVSSAFDTDYMLIQADMIDQAAAVLTEQGHTVEQKVIIGA